MALSPMMQQYNKIKKDYADCLLFYRLGDFYELFFDDAYTASKELELTLTGRNCGLEERAPMCGVPFHAADTYIARLVERGYKVAICEQTEDPAAAKGIVTREVVQIVTPGTLDISGAHESGENIYIASVYSSDDKTAVAYADITTGELFATDFDYSRDYSYLLSELSGIDPKEIVLSEQNSEIAETITESMQDVYYNTIDSSYFKLATCEKALLSQFDVSSLIPLNVDNREEIVCATGALILYLIDMQKQAPNQLKELKVIEAGNHMRLDRATMRNLELLETLYDHKTRGSLLGVLDKTKTAMGARLLKRFLKEPLNDAQAINARLSAVESLADDLMIRNNITASLKEIYDFERLTARVASMRANGRDLIALKVTLAQLPDIINNVSYLKSDLLSEIADDIDDFSALYEVIDSAIEEDPPLTITDGGVIKSSYSQELADLKDSISDAKSWIAGLEQTERERTGIKTIKVGYNKVFGYYIDVSRAMSDKVPEEYIRKQTLVNNERYITPELKEKESLVLSAEAKINALEYEIFKEVRSVIEPYIYRLQKASRAIALLDVLVSFAEVASMYNYVKPVVDDSDCLHISGGRHPAVEQLIGEGMFVSNDTDIDKNDKSLLIITGPNMSGKSTYMRQTAIIVLMAQIGSFVPANSAQIGVCDRVFTRIGASDNLAYGQSTFFIEMSELAGILRNATGKSLIILDEIGRGTSTFDGLSIAWATIEYLARQDVAIRTMFATHYHELTELENSYESIKNLSVDVAESGKNVVFLHKIVEGSASKSYGIHVAKIAGVPREIRHNAELKLKELEANAIGGSLESKQLTFFDSIPTESLAENPYAEVIEEIRKLRIEKMTPIEALVQLKEIQESLDD